MTSTACMKVSVTVASDTLEPNQECFDKAYSLVTLVLYPSQWSLNPLLQLLSGLEVFDPHSFHNRRESHRYCLHNLS